MDALIITSEGRVVLVRRLAAGNEKDAIKVEAFPGGTGNCEMSEVNGIESPSEQSDTFGVVHLQEGGAGNQEQGRRSISISPRT